MDKIRKKNGSLEDYSFTKIMKAVNKSAQRVLVKLTDKDFSELQNIVENELSKFRGNISVSDIHLIVENALDKVNPKVAKSYRDYRNYKQDYHKMLERVIDTANKLQDSADHSNANADSELVSTKRTLIYKSLSKEMYRKFFLNEEELQAIDDGYIYIHDIGDRSTTMNCCLFDMGKVLQNGFDMEGMHYNEPNSISSAINVLCDVMQMAGGAQYGGFTVPEIDSVLEPYVEKSYWKYLNEYRDLAYGLVAEYKPEEILLKAIECSSKAQYPDYLSLSGEGYVSSVYKKYVNYQKRWYLGEDNKVKENPNWVDCVISPMGCRAYLSPYYKEGGQEPINENDKPIFTGRWNGGAISLNLPMIYEKSKEEGKNFFKVLDHYLQIIRNLHKRTYDYIARFQASNNPLAYTQEGFYKGTLKPEQNIKPLLDYVTFSFGITALNELQELYNNKQLDEDNEFAYKTLQYINDFVNKYKKEDKILYAIYGTPAESLSYTQREQFVKKYGIVNEVGKHKYFSNSFHIPVWVEISPFDKMSKEAPFFHISNGGHICYTRIPTGKNLLAIQTEVEYAMDKGLYFGVNIAKSYCNDCGEQWDDDKLDSCPS